MAEGDVRGTILAVVLGPDRQIKVEAGGAPVFISEDNTEAQHVALLTARAMDSSVHEISRGVLIVVRH